MGLTRLHGSDAGRIGVFAGPLNGQAAAIQFAREMERLGYCTFWCGESSARGAFAQGAIYLAVDGTH
jgi:alkanesulfonate monooxygenase SsuD/methylene tetrahydromethanopterin reductase-like flavin-dependent oxidoreductase (luciferase family)